MDARFCRTAHIHRGFALALGLGVGLLGSACGGDEVVEIEEAAIVDGGEGVWKVHPASTDQLPLGRLAALGGAVGSEGVRFVLEELSLHQPVQVMLVSRDADDELALEVFKQSWSQPLLAASTGGEGVATLRFRTAERAAFRVSGEEGVEYQLLVWVGPAIEPIQPPAFTPASEVDAGGCGIGFAAALILVAAGAFAYRRFRASPVGGGGATAALLLAAVSSLLLAPSGDALARPGPGDPPEPITPQQQWKRTSDALHELRERLDALPETGVSGADDLIGATKILIPFLEQFGFIEPREAAVQPDYAPEGMPELPSRCYRDPTGKCADCFAAATEGLDKWRRLLEDQWVIYRQTELEAGRIMELADAAAGLHPTAKLLWAVTKTNPDEAHVKAQKEFYAAYDRNYNELVKRLNDSLIAVGKCEAEHFGDDDWYTRYGLPYYLFMRDRYTRR